MRPIRALRRFLQQHPETKEFSSQLGIAQLVDRSESLVRAIEGGRMEMSPKFARALSAMTGASKDWLMRADVDSEDVPSEHGGPLRHEETIARIQRQPAREQIKTSNYLRAARVDPETGESRKVAMPVSIQEQMVSNMTSLVENALSESLSRGDTRLMEEILLLLAKQSGSKEYL